MSRRQYTVVEGIYSHQEKMKATVRVDPLNAPESEEWENRFRAEQAAALLRFSGDVTPLLHNTEGRRRYYGQCPATR